MPTTHTYRVYFVQHMLGNGSFVCVFSMCKNAYSEANIVDLYNTDSFKIGLLGLNVCISEVHNCLCYD